MFGVMTIGIPVLERMTFGIQLFGVMTFRIQMFGMITVRINYLQRRHSEFKCSES